jgi:hypothetical protein
LKRLVVISDLHAGHRAGLTPYQTVQAAGGRGVQAARGAKTMRPRASRGRMEAANQDNVAQGLPPSHTTISPLSFASRR